VACITATFGARRSSTPAGLPRHRPRHWFLSSFLAIFRAPENLVSAGNVDIGRARTLRGLVPVAIVLSLSDEQGRPSSELDPVLAKDRIRSQRPETWTDYTIWTPWFFSGNVRIRLPVAAKNALRTAGAATQIVGSPTPPQNPPDGMMIDSTFGICAIRIES